MPPGPAPAPAREGSVTDWPAIAAAGSLGLLAVAAFHTIVALYQPGYWASPVWDEAYYVGIAKFGYQLESPDYATHSRLPFSPGWPLLLRAVAWSTGITPELVRCVLSGLLFVISCGALANLLGHFVTKRVVVLETVGFFAFWPGSLYFLSGYSEALYLPLVLFFLRAVLARTWGQAALLCAAALFVRLPAFVLLGTLIVAVVADAGMRQQLARALLVAALRLAWTIPLALLGLWLYLALLWENIRDPWSFLRSYEAWESYSDLSLRNLRLETAAEALDLADRPTVHLSVLAFLATPLLVFSQRTKMPAILTVYAAGAWVFFLLRDWSQAPFHDMLRWMAIVFPMHLAVIMLVDHLTPWLARIASAALILTSSLAWGWCILRFVSGEWVS